MTNTQLFLAIGLPILIVVLGFVWNSKSNRAEIAILRGEMNVKFAEVNGKFDVIAVHLAAINRTLEIVQQDLKHFNDVMNGLDKRLQVLESQP